MQHMHACNGLIKGNNQNWPTPTDMPTAHVETSNQHKICSFEEYVLRKRRNAGRSTTIVTESTFNSPASNARFKT
jgi:hypothetical protein